MSGQHSRQAIAPGNPEEPMDVTQAPTFLIGTRIEYAGKRYLVTKTGPQRLDGNRKERRAKEAEPRRMGAV